MRRNEKMLPRAVEERTTHPESAENMRMPGRSFLKKKEVDAIDPLPPLVENDANQSSHIAKRGGNGEHAEPHMPMLPNIANKQENHRNIAPSAASRGSIFIAARISRDVERA